VETVALAGEWRAKVGHVLTSHQSFPANQRLNQNSPSVLYNAMIHPLLPFPVKGAIWYQGESNSGRAETYQELFTTMIQDWRARWDVGDFPFLFVQIAPHN